MCYFADAKRGRVLQNIGGIANLTAIPAEGPPQAVIAFDTGPGNMVIDWLAQKLFGKPFDRNGALAARGTVIEPVLQRSAAASVFPSSRRRKTAGREQFGRAYAAEFLKKCLAHIQEPQRCTGDRDGLDRGEHCTKLLTFCAAENARRAVDFIVSGGGARNRTLMAMLAARLFPAVTSNGATGCCIRFCTGWNATA